MFYIWNTFTILDIFAPKPFIQEMKRIYFLLFAICVLSACNNGDDQSEDKSKDQPQTEQAAVGGDKDEHGCLTAAGETWSEIKQRCVRLFDIGVRLNPVEVNEQEAVLSAFVLFNDDKSKAELFLPKENGSIILDKTGGNEYSREAYKFDASQSVLYIGDTPKYKGA